MSSFGLILAASLLAQAPQSTPVAVTAPAATQAATPPAVQETDDAADAQQAAAGSHVRVVRLSQARGTVTANRDPSLGFETAPVNLPIVQGTQLRTGQGVAEIEFEDSSVLRAAPATELVFTELSRTPTGTTVSRISVLHGTVYALLEKTKGNIFELQAAQGSTSLPPGAEIRLIAGSALQLATIKGKISFDPASGTPVEIGKDKELRLNPANTAAPQFVASITDAPYDEWNAQQDDFHKSYAKGNGLAGSPYSYGLDDLNYYGSWADVDDCGRVWRPYFASAAWDPYSNGLWASYPGGYSWVSVYPWGWAPYHYGAWVNCGAGGWGWMPGGAWGGLGFGGGLGGIYGGGGGIGRRRIWGHPPHRPVYPPHGPLRGQGMIAVNKAPLPLSTMNSSTHVFTFRNDSAGLGIPRDMFGRLNKASAAVEHGRAVALPMVSAGGGSPARLENGRIVVGMPPQWRPAEGSKGPVAASSFNRMANGGGGGSSFRPAPSGGGASSFHNAAPAASAPSFHASVPASAPAASSAAHK